MQICGFTIEAYVDKQGIIKRKYKSQGHKFKMNPNKNLQGSIKSLAKLLALDEFLRYHKFPFSKSEFTILVDVVQKYLNCSRRTASSYAYVIWILKHREVK